MPPECYCPAAGERHKLLLKAFEVIPTEGQLALCRAVQSMPLVFYTR